jgi:hypothetical protein
MPDNSENPNDINPPSTRESLPLSASQAGEDGGESTERDLAVYDAYAMDAEGYTPPAADIGDFPVNHISDELPASVITRMREERALSADSRAELEGSTEDGMSAVYVEGRYRFVTPCHVAKEGLRATQICVTCFGDLKRPVETATMLSCGHWSTADFASGERRHLCGVCGEWSVIKAERVAITRYNVRPLSVSEQLTLTEEP